MKYLIALLLVVNSTNSFNQKILKDIHLYHMLKQGNEQYQFKVLDKDARGVKFFKKDRFYYWYKAQHVLSTQGGASGLLLNGEFEAFYDTKQLSRKGHFTKGLKDKEWLYWRPDGTLIKTENWKKGKLTGVEKHYDLQGEVVQVINHKMFKKYRENADSVIISKRNIEQIRLKDSLGTVYRIENKKNGVLHGVIKDIDGKKSIKTKYKNGVLVEKSEKKWWDFLKKKSKEDQPKKEKKESKEKIKEKPEKEKKKNDSKKTQEK